MDNKCIYLVYENNLENLQTFKTLDEVANYIKTIKDFNILHISKGKFEKIGGNENDNNRD